MNTNIAMLTLTSEAQRRVAHGPDAVQDEHELGARLKGMLARLPPLEALALRLRFGLDDGVPRTRQQMGAAMGVSPARAQRLEARALRTLQGCGADLGAFLDP